MQLLLCVFVLRERGNKKMKERREGSMTFRSLRFFIFNWKTAIKREKEMDFGCGRGRNFHVEIFSAVVTPRQAWLMKATFKTWCSKEEQLFERKMWNETWLYIGLCWWHSCGVLIPQVFFSLQAKIIHLKCVTTKEWPSTLYIFALLRAKQGSDHLLSSRWVRLSYIVVCLLAAFCHKIYRYDDYAPGSITTTTRECYNGTR